MKIIINTQKGVRIIESENILYCQAYGNNTKVFLFNKNINDAKDYFVSVKSLKEFESILPTIEFYRCHKSYIINLKYFYEFELSTNKIILENGVGINISRTKKADAKEKLLKYIENYNLPFIKKMDT